jgi:hypothetical protein
LCSPLEKAYAPPKRASRAFLKKRKILCGKGKEGDLSERNGLFNENAHSTVKCTRGHIRDEPRDSLQWCFKV